MIVLAAWAGIVAAANVAVSGAVFRWEGRRGRPAPWAQALSFAVHAALIFGTAHAFWRRGASPGGLVGFIGTAALLQTAGLALLTLRRGDR